MIDRVRQIMAETQLASLLQEVQFPISKEEMVQIACEHNAPDKVIEILDSLPDMVYSSAGELYQYWHRKKEGD